MRNKLLILLMLVLTTSIASAGIRIGHFNSSRESYGFAGSYISGARQALIDAGHTLVSTSNVDGAFLSGVDAFYTGLLNGSVSGTEVSAMQSFVDNQGGFLFIQTDYDTGPWFAPANTILSNWGIAHGGTYSNDGGHYTVGSTEWVTNPNVVAGFTGSAHSVVTQAPDDFEVLAKDDAGRTIMGVFDAGAGRSSDVLIATDIDFWSSYGWGNSQNRDLWENIWQSAAGQIEDNDDDNVIPVPGSILLVSLGTGLVSFMRRRFTA